MRLSIRLAIAMIALVLLTVGAVSVLSYRNLEVAIFPRAMDRIEGHARLLASELEGYARGARDDILGFRSAVALEGMVRARLAGGTDPIDGTPEGAWRERMAARYLAERIHVNKVCERTRLATRLVSIDDLLVVAPQV